MNDISFTVHPGSVTGFLGPNGAGKSTTMRMIVGLDRPTGGDVTVGGKHYRDHRAPLREVGALLEAKAVHPGRSAFQHLHALAATHGIPRRRVKEVIDMAGLGPVAKKRVGGFSLGMGQRLGIAAAMLGDPRTVILDEPVNGLDPDGVLWVRNFVRELAADGRTVFLSSHLMSEMTQTADHVIVIGRGKILADDPIDAVINRQQKDNTLVRTDQPGELQAVLGDGATTDSEPNLLHVSGVDPRRIAQVALDNRILIYELTPQRASLEEAYMGLTRDDVEYQSHGVVTGADGGPEAGTKSAKKSKAAKRSARKAQGGGE
ncbi:ABC-2 type transport system ATP-binding protein [Spelaeicoccus albus]|uniref:ABC-2 type transport system ATP-binding protein n=1 Tax=Spelaeicoccus albus TaxID=1280376 RepID=A0A7Z0D2B4_9MICO|nr:ABC-2 type transport system ATP-binding protein [Spelaeicoccus albus]